MAVDWSHINSSSNNTQGVLTFFSALRAGNLDMKLILIPNKQMKTKRQPKSLLRAGNLDMKLILIPNKQIKTNRQPKSLASLGGMLCVQQHGCQLYLQ